MAAKASDAPIPQPHSSSPPFLILDDNAALGEALVKQGALSEADLGRALRLQKETGEQLAALVVKLGLASERHVAAAMAALLGMPLIEAQDYPETALLPEEISVRFLRHHGIVPVQDESDHIVLAMQDPWDKRPADAVALACGKAVQRCVGIPSEIETAIERLYGDGKSTMGQLIEEIGTPDEALLDDVEHLKDLASEAPIVRLVNLLIQRAVEAGASDIHIEPFQNRLKVRYRVDGILREIEAPPPRSSAAVISRIKLMAHLNIAERRLPQDGRFKLRTQGKEIDARVSTVPTLHGESVVMRLLDSATVELDFDVLGFNTAVRERFCTSLKLPHGIVLVTGPTGSGKTTTLYAALAMLNTSERKIITVEDPIEYQLEGINQIQIKPKIGLNFATSLRSIVRQDPDVIMVGEMRDLETASIAVQSALTGHLVLSTLHTNDAPGAVTRLLDMGVEDYLLVSTVNGILAQRLVRTLCPHCRTSYPVLDELCAELNLQRYAETPITLYGAKGCELCDGTGYQGRTVIVELLGMTDAIRRLVLNHATASEISAAAQKEGMRTLRQDGLAKAVRGLTSIEEVLRVTQES